MPGAFTSHVECVWPMNTVAIQIDHYLLLDKLSEIYSGEVVIHSSSRLKPLAH